MTGVVSPRTQLKMEEEASQVYRQDLNDRVSKWKFLEFINRRDINGQLRSIQSRLTETKHDKSEMRKEKKSLKMDLSQAKHVLQSACESLLSKRSLLADKKNRLKTLKREECAIKSRLPEMTDTSIDMAVSDEVIYDAYHTSDELSAIDSALDEELVRLEREMKGISDDITDLASQVDFV